MYEVNKDLVQFLDNLQLRTGGSRQVIPTQMEGMYNVGRNIPGAQNILILAL